MELVRITLLACFLRAMSTGTSVAKAVGGSFKISTPLLRVLVLPNCVIVEPNLFYKYFSFIAMEPYPGMTGFFSLNNPL
jgi:hypothetical protein